MTASLPVQPVTFIIPPDIQAGIDAGQLVRWGGIVRDLQGRIFTHLKEVPLPKKGPANAQRAAAAILKDKRVLTVIVLTSTVAAGGTVYVFRDRRRAKQCAQALNASLIAYLEAARDARLDQAAIDQLLADLDAAEAYARDGRVAVAANLVELVMDYTTKLAEANSVDLEELDTTLSGEAASMALRRHLKVQRSIFDSAARPPRLSGVMKKPPPASGYRR